MKRYKLIKWSNCNFIQKLFRTSVSLVVALAVSMVGIYLNGYSSPAVAKSTSRPEREQKTFILAATEETDAIEEEVVVITEEEYFEEYYYEEETFEEAFDEEAYWYFTDGDIEILAKTLYGEANCVDDVGKAMVVWCILNRYDSGLFGGTITEICTAPYQFEGYYPDYPVTEDNLAIIYEVINEWELEKSGYEVNRALPSDYLFFVADSVPENNYWHNAFYKYTDVVSGDIVYY